MGGSSSDSHHPFKKEKKKKKKKVPDAGSQSQKLKFKADQNQTEYFFCKKQDHWKRNYPQYIASLDPNRPKKKKQSVAGQGTYVITPCNFFSFDTMTWVLDIGSPIHICISL